MTYFKKDKKEKDINLGLEDCIKEVSSEDMTKEDWEELNEYFSTDHEDIDFELPL